MAEQVDIIAGGDLGGTMRLGLYPADLAEGSLAAELYGVERVSERHRHRYEVNNAYRDAPAEAGLVFSGLSPDRNLVEYVELPRDVHPYYIATQAHPELRSRPTDPHPLFRGLVGAARRAPPRERAVRRRADGRCLIAADAVPESSLRDEPLDVEVVESDVVFEGRVWDIRSDTFLYNGERVARDYVDHTGAVAIVALDDDDRVLLIQQYRHPIRHRDWEIPAGLLDIDGRGAASRPRGASSRRRSTSSPATGSRCVSIFSTPGGSNEVVHLFLARGLSPRPDVHAREDEEVDIRIEWVPLADAVDRRARGADAQRDPRHPACSPRRALRAGRGAASRRTDMRRRSGRGRLPAARHDRARAVGAHRRGVPARPRGLRRLAGRARHRRDRRR